MITFSAGYVADDPESLFSDSFDGQSSQKDDPEKMVEYLSAKWMTYNRQWKTAMFPAVDPDGCPAVVNGILLERLLGQGQPGKNMWRAMAAPDIDASDIYRVKLRQVNGSLLYIFNQLISLDRNIVASSGPLS